MATTVKTYIVDAAHDKSESDSPYDSIARVYPRNVLDREVQNYIDGLDTTPNLIDTSMTTLGHRIFVLVTIETD